MIEAAHAKGTLGDLVLAAAGSCGDAGAAAELERIVVRLGRECRAKLSLSAAEQDEVVQRSLARLLSAPTRSLERYEGRGSLTAWLRVCVTREGLMLRRAEHRREATVELHEAVEPLFDPELRLLEAEGRTTVKSAFQTAFGELSSRDRLLLAYQVLDGLSVREIGALIGVDGSNVSRRLARIRRDLLARTRASLRAGHGLGETSIDDVLSMLDSQLDLSLSRLLRAESRDHDGGK